MTPLAECRQVEQPASLRPLVVHVGGGQNHDRPGVFAEAVVVDPAPLATVPKLKPRWDVHMVGGGDWYEGYAGAPLLLIAGWSGSDD